MAVAELLLVRHGESVGNVAATAAQQAGAEVIDVRMRDADVPLSPIGQDQAAALGRWLGGVGSGSAPQGVWCSPYARAVQTAETALSVAGRQLPFVIDERLRDRELGILDLLTTVGVEARLPEEAARRRWLGKLYYRPPGGESWADVALRLRSLLRDLDHASAPERLLVVCHDAVIMLFRYVCEGLHEAELLSLAASGSIRNASITRLVRDPGSGRWTADAYNADEHLRAAGVPTTEHVGNPDAFPH